MKDLYVNFRNAMVNPDHIHSKYKYSIRPATKASIYSDDGKILIFTRRNVNSRFENPLKTKGLGLKLLNFDTSEIEDTTNNLKLSQMCEPLHRFGDPKDYALVDRFGKKTRRGTLTYFPPNCPFLGLSIFDKLFEEEILFYK